MDAARDARCPVVHAQPCWRTVAELEDCNVYPFNAVLI